MMLMLYILSGCGGTRGQVELLESQLRRQEDYIAQMQKKMKSTEQDLRNSREELASYQTMNSQVTTASGILPEQSSALFSTQNIKIDPLHTGIIMLESNQSQLMTIVITPFDDGNEIVRVPGEIKIDVCDLSTSPRKILGHWEFDLNETAESWQRNFLTAGFQFQFPVQFAASENIQIAARLTTPDKRCFEASHKMSFSPNASRVQKSQKISPPTKVNTTGAKPGQITPKLIPTQFHINQARSEKNPSPHNLPGTTSGGVIGETNPRETGVPLPTDDPAEVVPSGQTPPAGQLPVQGGAKKPNAGQVNSPVKGTKLDTSVNWREDEIPVYR
jgi:hypothetical protein